MSLAPACIHCSKLGACHESNVSRILENYYCQQFEEVPTQEEVTARVDIINKFGTEGLRALLPTQLQDEEEQ